MEKASSLGPMVRYMMVSGTIMSRPDSEYGKEQKVTHISENG